VGTALHDALGDDGIATALVEVDELARCYPPLDRGRSIDHLRLVAESFRARGYELLLVMPPSRTRTTRRRRWTPPAATRTCWSAWKPNRRRSESESRRASPLIGPG
jgi:hypothetical protein